MSEIEINEKIAEIILDVVNSHPGLKGEIVKNYHISRRILTPKKLFRADWSTRFRLRLAIYQNIPDADYLQMLKDINEETMTFADLEDGSPEALIKAHAGSPIGRKR
jgi:hypothetical protein